jgi:hypothetical protein
MGKFIVVGFFNDNNQPFVTAVEPHKVSEHDSEQDQARAAARLALLDLRRTNGLLDEEELDVSVVEVLHYGAGVLGNNTVVCWDELIERGEDRRAQAW